ncbi:MAG: diguanylate cyclase [Methylococcaceae bacterium]|nr:diguanylate cyclase [Methylococcaceae bacterium]
MVEAAHILIVDDDPMIGKTLGDILRVKGYRISVASSGADAVELTGRNRFNLVLVDLRLPDMTGIAVIERIKAMAPTTELIVLTGHASLATAIEATDKGAFSYLAKPYQMDELLLRIRLGIEKQRAQEEIIRLASHPRLNPNPVLEIDSRACIAYLNPAAEQRFPDLKDLGLEHPLLASLQDLLQPSGAGDEAPVTVREVQLGGDVFELYISYVAESALVRIYAIDISERVRAQKTIEQLRNELELILNSAGEGILTLNANGEHTLVNPAARQMLGYTEEEFFSRRSHDLWHHRRSDGSPYPESECPVFLTLQDGEERRRDNEVFWHHDGSCFPVSYVCTPIRKDHRIDGVVVVFEDITQRKQAEEEHRRLATTDELTGIANRRAFASKLEVELARAKRYQSDLALIMYDIDHFKQVNDTYGHAVGDEVLRAVTEIVRHNLRSVDTLARWGGEEFIILAPNADLDGARQLADKLKSSIADGGLTVVGSVTASFGVTVTVEKDDSTSLLKRVDDALYRAKENGRNRVEVLP